MPDSRDRLVTGLVTSQPQLANRQELDDAILDLIETVVVGVEDRARRIEIELIVGAGVPGQFEDAVEPRADPRMLR